MESNRCFLIKILTLLIDDSRVSRNIGFVVYFVSLIAVFKGLTRIKK